MVTFHDSFDRANTLSTLGPNPDGFTYEYPGGTCRILSNAAIPHAPRTSFPKAVIDTGTKDIDMEMYCGASSAFVWRLANNSNYLALGFSKQRLVSGNNDRGTLEIRRYTATGYQTLDKYEWYAVGISNTAKIYVQARGTRLAVWFNDNLIFNLYDTVPAVGTKHGIGFTDWVSKSYVYPYISYLTWFAPSSAPTAMTINSQGPLNPDQANTITWNTQDNDVGDYQTAYQLYWRYPEDTDWSTTGKVTKPTKSHTFAAGTFRGGQLQVSGYFWDRENLLSPAAPSVYFQVVAQENAPTILSPANGSTVTGPLQQVSWSASRQASWEIRRVASSGGSPDTGTVYWSYSSAVEESDTYQTSVPFDVSGRTEFIQLRTATPESVVSDWTSIQVSTSFTQPTAPSLTTKIINGDSIEITAINPADSPVPVTSNEIWVYGDPLAKDGESVQIATGVPNNGAFIWDTPASGIEYLFAVKAIGSNGTWITSVPLSGDSGTGSPDIGTGGFNAGFLVGI